MNKIYLKLTVILLLFIGACEGEEEENSCRIATIENIDLNSSSLLSFSYDANGRVSIADVSYFLGDNIASSSALLTYDQSGRLVRIFNNDSLFTDIKYLQDTILVSRPFISGTTVFRTQSIYLLDEQNRITDLVNVHRYEYNDQRQVQKVLRTNGELVSEWIYDQNQNPLEGIFVTATFTSTANIISAGEIVTYYDFGFLARGAYNALDFKSYINGNIVFEANFEPEYNSDGDPVRFVDRATGREQIFTYECP